jgi:hypothetical protein
VLNIFLSQLTKKNGDFMNKFILSLLFLIALSGEALAQSQTLFTTDYNDGYSDDTGLFFDLTAINDVSIESFGLYSDANTGEAVEVQIYVRSGSHVGFDGSSAGWELIASFSRSNNNYSDIDDFVLDTVLGIPAGETMGIYAFSPVGGLSHDDKTGPETHSDSNLSLTSDFGSEYGAFSGDNDNSMNFAGSITYVEGLPTSGSPVSVPTLSTYGLMLAGLALLLMARRRLLVTVRQK